MAEYLYLGHVPIAKLDYAQHANLDQQSWLSMINRWADWNGGDSTSALYAIHTDHLGTPQRMTDAQQRLVWRAGHSSFGKAKLTSAKVTLNLRLLGQYFDAESGTHYNYFRDYDPTTGRFIESDPIGLRGGFNTYAYVGGNPVSRIDPFGLLDRLVFDGKTLTGYDDSAIEFSVPAVSGPWGKGRLPEGVYVGNNLRRRNDNKAMICKDGNGWSLDLDPNFRTDRSLLRIHPDGNVPGTEGCIGPDCKYQQQVYDALRNYFNDPINKSIPVTVS